DLKGGSHLVMRVKTDEVLKSVTLNDAVAIDKAVKDDGLPVKEVRPDTNGGNYRIILETTDPSKLSAIEDSAKKKLGSDNSIWTSSVSGNTIVWTLPIASQTSLAEQATEQAQRIIESRLEALLVAEPLVQRHGSQTSHQILVQMPGIQDPERVKELLGKPSKLELVHIVGPASPSPFQTYNSEDEAKTSLGGNVPANRRVLPYIERDEPTAAGNQAAADAAAAAQKPKKWVVVESPAVVDGSELRSAAAVQAQGSGDTYSISFSLKPVGAQKFGTWTAASINEYMGVVLNNEVKSIAYIKSAISDSGEISGRFTKQSADDLALILKSGALPAGIDYMEERTVGPSLGADSIRSGVRASIVGLIMVVLFMLIYYRGSGVNAVVALILNMILMLAGLVLMKATLTLPGIAGIILTIGMAVDSNVLIFERIREELRTGKTIPSAIEQGFARAFVTIIDTHVTTTVSSLFLFLFGTGPLKGFAVTLVLGLLINLFSAVYVSRTIFMWELSRKKKLESLSI
ncbi:MAG TPA: protein translocase subunit SecD, partial [Pyrinomonadaceae bacterium]|nr:protein translocase subunit SecD [Pyrinomonadaceae bacterium]